MTPGRIKRLHVDQRLVRRDEPAVTIQTSAGSIKCREATILGPSRMIHRPDAPLSCGARLWVETEAEVQWVS